VHDIARAEDLDDSSQFRDLPALAESLRRSGLTVIEREPVNPDSLRGLKAAARGALDLCAQNKRREAAQALLSAVQPSDPPQEARVLLKKAVALLRDEGDLDATEAAMSRLADLPDVPGEWLHSLHHQLTLLAAEVRRFDNAVHHARMALEYAPHASTPLHIPVAWTNIGYYLVEAGKHEEAIDPLRTAIAEYERLAEPNPVETANAQLNLAMALVLTGEKTESRQLLETARPIMAARPHDRRCVKIPRVEARVACLEADHVTAVRLAAQAVEEDKRVCPEKLSEDEEFLNTLKSQA
jgi:tetratricopeptide (TPR) repeat protein